MKLKLNQNLRRALCAAVLSLATWATTVGTATLVATQLLSSQAMAADVSFAGSDDEAAPSELQWNADAAFDGSTFNGGDNASFSGYTDATLSAATTVGTLGVNGGALDITTGGNALTLGNINGTGTLTLDGATSITGDVNFTGNVVIASGTTAFGTGEANTKNIEASSIQIEAGAQMNIGHAAADWRDSTSLILNGGTLHSLDMGVNGNGGVQFGALYVNANSTISHQWNGVWGFRVLSGEGNINFNAGTRGTGEAGELRFAGVTDYNGTIIGANGNGDDYLRFSGVIEQRDGKTLTVTGNIASSLDGITFRGDGAASFGATNISGTNIQKSGTITMGTVTFAAADASLNVQGGTLVLSHTSYAGSGTISAGAAQMQFSAAGDVSVSTAGFQLGAYATSAGTAAAPLITTMNVGDKTVSISSAISDVAGSVGGLTIAGTGTLALSGSNTFSGGITANTGTLSLAHYSAAGTGAITVGGGALNMNDLAVANTVNYTAGTISGAAAFAGTLNVNAGALTLDAISGSVHVASGAALTLSGTWDYSSAMDNAGTITLGDGLLIDLQGVSFTESGGVYSLTLFSGETGDAALLDSILGSGAGVDLSKFTGLQTSKREYSYADGVLSYTTTAQDLVHSSGLLNWQEGTVFDGGAIFAAGDNVTFNTGDIAVAADVEVGTLVTSRVVGFLSSDAPTTITAALVEINGETTIDDGVTLQAGLINVNDGATLRAASIGTSDVSLGGKAELEITTALAAGANVLNNISSTDTSSTLTLSLSGEGSSIEALNFDGALHISSGVWDASAAEVSSFTSAMLLNSSVLDMSAVNLGAAASLDNLTGDADSMIKAAFSTDAANGTNMQLTDGFTGSVEVLSGTISARYSDLGGASNLILNNGTGLVFNQLGNTHTFGTAISLADGATVTIRSWGGAGTRTLSGAITGAANTVINKTDVGTIAMSDLTGFAGTINIAAGTLQVNSDANLNSLTIANGASISIGANLNVTAGADNARLQRQNSGGLTIDVGAGSTFTENVYWRIHNGTYNVQGGGTYIIENFLGTAEGANATTLNIAANTTLKVMGETNETRASNIAGFMLSNWDATSTVNVNGTLDLHSGLSNQNGTGIINVGTDGTLILRKGLYGTAETTGEMTINTVTNATLQLGDQTSSSDTINTNIAAGTNIVAIDADITDANTTVNVINPLKLSGTGSVNVSAESGITALNMNGAISQLAVAEGASAHSTGLAITAAAGQTVTLSGINSYTGGTTLSGAGTLTAGSASAFGTGAVTVHAGTLNANGQAITNDVTVNGGSIQGFSAYAGQLTIAGTTSVSDQITGSITVAEAGALTLSGVWDYSSLMYVAGEVTLGADLQIDLSGVTFTESGGTYSLELFAFTNTGSVDLSAWFTDGRVDASSLTGYTAQDGYVFSYDHGLLTYASAEPPPVGDIEIAPDVTRPLTGPTDVNITFTGDGGGTANLGGGFSQGPDSVISGDGKVIATGGDSELSGANTYTGETRVQNGATLTVAGDEAMGTSALIVEAGGSASLAAGVTIGNDVDLVGTGKMETGVFTLGAKENADTGILTGASKQIASDSITSAGIVAASIALADSRQGSITDSVLINTAVTLGTGSTLTMTDVIQGVGTTITNNDATLKLHNQEIHAFSGVGLTEGNIVENLTTVEGNQKDMLVYSLTSISVANVEITGTLTLQIALTGDDLQAYKDYIAVDGNSVAFALQDISAADFKSGYSDVMIHVYDSAIGGTSLWSGAALGQTVVGGNVAFYIPEPSTATLSLLALVGLLARRRRQAV